MVHVSAIIMVHPVLAENGSAVPICWGAGRTSRKVLPRPGALSTVNIAAMGSGNGPGNGQPDSQSIVVAFVATVHVRLVEPLEDAFVQHRVYAGSLVAEGNRHTAVCAAFSDYGYLATIRAELERIAK